MKDGMTELEDLIQRANATPWGKTCSALWAQAATLAEESGDLETAVRCYGELCAAYMSGGESTRVMAPFMWLDSMLKTRPELFSEDAIALFGWYYKYVIATVRSIPTVPVAQCHAILEEMRRHYQERGDSMRAYHIRAYLFHRDMGNAEDAELSYQSWQSAEPSELSDCPRCDPSYEVAYYRRRAQWEDAVRAGDHALADPSEYCDAQPEALLSLMMIPWLHVGRDNESWAAHTRAYRRYQQHSRFFEHLPDHWEYLAISGRCGRPERLERGLTILLRHMSWWPEAENSRDLMDAAVSAYLLLDSFEVDERQRVLPVTLPGEELGWAPRSNVANPTIDEAAQWMRTLALDIARQFDERPGHPDPGYETRRVMQRFNPPLPDALPERSGLLDITGLGDYSSDITISSPAEAPTDPLGKGAPQAAVSDLSEEASATLSEEPAKTAAEPNDAETVADDELAPVSLVVTNEWKGMPPLELLERSWQLCTDMDTIYSVELTHRLRVTPSLTEELAAQIPQELEEAWEWLMDSMSSATNMEHDRPPRTRTNSDPAYDLICQAHTHLDESKFRQAALLADQATRTKSADPIGVRVNALVIMAIAASKAGYASEAIDAARDGANLVARLGYDQELSGHLWFLATLLVKSRRFVEAAEVAQNGLDIIARYPELWAYHVRLLAVAAEANEKLEYFDACAAYHRKAAEIMEAHGDYDRGAGAYQAAAEAYLQAHDFAHAIEARAAIVRFVRHMLGVEQLEYDMADPALEEDYQRLRSRVGTWWETLRGALLAYAQTIVAQPGQVPDQDQAQMEAIMEELHDIVTRPDLDDFFDHDIARREAEWHADYAYTLWNCFRYAAALDEQRIAINEFQRMGIVSQEARHTLSLAYMFRALGEPDSARENAQRVIDLLSGPQWSGDSRRTQARQLLKELDEA